MGAGITLLVVGAILAFAVKDAMPGINLGVVGVILMLAGAAVLVHARQTAARTKRVVTREDGPDLPQTHVTEQVVEETDRDHPGRY